MLILAVATVTDSQQAARATPTEDFSQLLLDAASRDNERGLSVPELESVLGELHSIADSPHWDSKVRIYKLSLGRKLEIVTYDSDSVHFGFVIEKSGTPTLVWK